MTDIVAYENVGGGNAEFAFDGGDHWIQILPGQHQDITGHPGQIKALTFDDDGDTAQFAFLSGNFAGGDDHRIVGFQVDRDGTHAQALAERSLGEAQKEPGQE